MRVAFVSTIFGYPWGGPDKRWTLTARACLERGDAVFLGVSPVTSVHPLVEELVQNGAVLYRRPSSADYRGRINAILRKTLILCGGNIEGALIKFRPDVVFLLLGGTFDALNETHLISFLQKSKIPYAVSCSLTRGDEIFSEAQKDYLQRFFAGAAATLFMSSGNLELAERQLGANIPRTSLIQNPLLMSTPGAQPWPKPTRNLQMGFVGRIDMEHKGLDLFIEAVARVNATHPVDFHLTGRNERPTEFDRLVKGLGLENRIFLHEQVEASSLPETYGRAEIVILSSRWEGCASTMLEAMMAGRPLLVTPVGGVADWLTDGVNAFVAEDVSAKALEKALYRVHSARAQLPQMGEAARNAFESRRDRDPVGTLMEILDRASAKNCTI